MSNTAKSKDGGAQPDLSAEGWLRSKVEGLERGYRGGLEVVHLADVLAVISELGNRQGCACRCCAHNEGSDCGCECHADGKCSFRLRASDGGSLPQQKKDNAL